jgi:ABC-type sugar transport system permease subunit
VTSASGADTSRTRAAPSAARVLKWSGEVLFVLPIVAVIGLAIVVPSVSVIAYSFTKWDPGYHSPWVGLDNYKELATSADFHQILINQGIFLLGIPLWMILPLAIAFVLYEGIPFPGVFRTIFFFPAMVSPALVGILFTFILLPDGPLNSALRSVGLGSLAHSWLAEQNLARPTIIVLLAWATMGVGVVIFSAALSALPPELLEAAALDGANWWRRLWHVVLPGIRGTVELWAVILVVTIFLGVFPWIFTLTRGGPGKLTTTFDFDIYQNALTFGYFGTAAAESVYLLLIVGLIILIGVKIFHRRED